MKNLLWVCCLSLAIVSIGCATTFKPSITQLSDGQYQIVVAATSNNIMTISNPVNKEDLNKEREKVAAQKCEKFDIISIDFKEHTMSDGYDLAGVIK